MLQELVVVLRWHPGREPRRGAAARLAKKRIAAANIRVQRADMPAF